MLNPATITFIILCIALVLFLSERVRPDLVALLVLLSLAVTRVLTVQEAFSGFSRSAVITILSIFILADGLQRSGVTDRLGEWILRLAGSGEARLILAITATGAFLSLFMNNIAAASLLLPAVMGVSRKVRLSPSRLLIPLAFGTILGGMATLFTTTNIIASSLLREQGITGFGVLDFVRLGIPIVVVGVAYLSFLGRKLLPREFPIHRMSDVSQIESNLSEVYRLRERLIRAHIPPSSWLAGKALRQSNLREIYRLNVIAIERDGHNVLTPTGDMVIQPGDILLLSGKLEDISTQELNKVFDILPERNVPEPDLETGAVVLIETVLSPRSSLIGQTLRQAHFREKYDMNVIAIWRAGRPIRTGLSDLPLQFGDALLLLGPRSRLNLLRSEPALILLSEGGYRQVAARRRGWLALAIMGVSVLLASLNSASIGEVMLGGAVAMVITGILSMDEAYQAVDWKIIFLIAGMLPMGTAMTKTGAAVILGNRVVELVGSASPLTLLAGLVLLTVFLSQIMNGAVVATMMVPVAIGASRQLGLDPRAMAMGIALATSIVFITPFGHAVNVLVMSPGGYQIRDYTRVGFPLTALLLLLVIFLLPVFWPLR